MDWIDESIMDDLKFENFQLKQEVEKLKQELEELRTRLKIKGEESQAV